MEDKVDDLGVPIKNSVTETDDLGVPKKKILDTSSINSESPSPSESTGSESGFVVPSISKIKQDNVAKVDLGNSKVIKERMASDFANNPNPVFREKYIDTLSKKGYDKKQLEQYVGSLNTPENYKSPTDAMDLNNTVGDIVSDYGKKVGETFMEGNKQVNEAVDEIPLRVKEINTSKPITDIDFSHPVLKAALGTMTAVASPVIAAFNMATEGIAKSAKETLPEPQAKIVGEALPTVFSLAHKAAASLGYTPEQDTNGDILLSFVDFIIGGKAMEVGGKSIKSVKEFKDVAEKASKGELNPEEQKQFESGVNEISTTSLDDIKKDAEQKDVPQAKEIVEKINEVESKAIPNNDLHTQLAALEQAHDALPGGDLKSKLYQDIDFKKREIEAKEKEQIDAHLNDAKSNADKATVVSELDNKISQAEADKDVIKDNPVAYKVAEDHIDELKAQKEAIQPTEQVGGVKDLSNYISDKPNGSEALAKDVSDKLKEVGFKVSGNVATSESQYGTSHYVVANDASGNSYKFRISNHSVENKSRMNDEYHVKSDNVGKQILKAEQKAFPERFEDSGEIFISKKDLLDTDKIIKENDNGSVLVKRVVEKGISKRKEQVIAEKELNKNETIPEKLEYKEPDPFDGKDYSKGKTSEDIAIKEGLDIKEEKEGSRGKNIVEESSLPPREVGISEEMRAKQRKELGLDDLPPIDKNISEHKHEYLNKEANRIVESGEVDFRKLAEEVVNENRTTNDLDKAVLLRGATELGKTIEASKVKVDEAKASGNKILEEQASDEYLQALSDLNNIHNALTIAGTEAGRNLAAMKQSMKDDYSVGSLYTRFKKANGDKALPKEIINRLDTYAVKIKELDTLVKAQEELLKKQGVDIEDLKSRKPNTKEKIAAVREKRSKIFDEWKKSRDVDNEVTKQGIGFSEKDLLFASKIALSYLEEGYLTTMQVSKQLKKDSKELLGIKLSDEDIANILNGEVEGKKVIENFENNGIKSSKKSLSDLVNQEQKAIKNLGKEKKEKSNIPTDQEIKEEALLRGANEVLNNFKLERAKLKRKVNAEASALEYANRSKSEKIKEGISNVMNVPRSLMASFDFSAPLRQGLVASVAHPKIASKAFPEMFKQAFSQKNFDNWLISYKDTPDYKLAHNSELYIADPSDLHLNGREESFMSNLAERIPVVGGAIKASERAYVGYLNKLRSDVFKQGVEQLQKNGKDFEKNPEEFKALADFINSSTGRGKLPNKTIEDAAPLLNSFLFSPRLIASRINLLNPVYYAKMPAQVRVMALTDMAKFVGFGTTCLALAKLGGAEVETDPRSTEFAKIKVGDTRYDMLGGFQQYIRLGSQLATGKKVTQKGIIDLTKPNFKQISRGSELLKFARQKLSPAAGIVVDVLTGADVMGKPITVKDEIYTHFSPLQLQSALEAYDNGGMPKVWQTTIPSMFGVGVQTYNNRKSDDKLKQEFLKMTF